MGTLCKTEGASSLCRLRRSRHLNCVTTGSFLRPLSSSLVSASSFLCGPCLSAARRPTADLRGASWAPLVAISTQRLVVRACTSWERDRMRSRSCSVLKPLKLEPVFALNGAPLLQRVSIRHRVRCLGGCRPGRGGRQPVLPIACRVTECAVARWVDTIDELLHGTIGSVPSTRFGIEDVDALVSK